MGVTHFTGLAVEEDFALAGDAVIDGDLEVIGSGSIGDTEVLGELSIIPGSAGGLGIKVKEATKTLSGASSTITLEVPVGAKVIGVQLRVDTLITAETGVSWTATFSGGLTTQIATAQAFTKNTKINVLMDENAAATIVTSSVANIAITPDAGTFTAGVVRAIVYYQELTAMADAA